MASPRHKHTKLHVRALPGKDVKEIDERGAPLLACRIVGKETVVEDGVAISVVIPEGVFVPYSSHYVAKLKEGSLRAVDAETAALAGVALVLTDL